MREKHTIKTAYTNGLPGDEHIMFETCRRHQELNWNINAKNEPHCYLQKKSRCTQLQTFWKY